MDADDGRARARARGAIAAALASLATLLPAAPQAGAFSLSDLVASPADNRAGANSDLTLGLTVQEPAADLRDLTIHLPPGLVGNPLATPTCSESQLAADACPAASDVGDISNGVTVTVLGFVPVPLTVSGHVYNVTPRAGEPARFGIVLNPLPFDVPLLGDVLFPKLVLQSGAVLRPGDFGLDTVLTDLPNSTTVAGMQTQIDIRTVEMTLSGQVGNPPQGFLRNPTSCGTHTVGFSARAYNGATASGSTTFETTDCAALPFAPGFSAKLRPQGRRGLKPRVATAITQTVAEAGLRRARVFLPRELGADNAVLSNQCAEDQFQAGACPEASIVGTAVAASPLQSEPLTGPVALVTPTAPGLPEIGLDLRGPLALKLKGSFVLGPQGTGVEFEGLPDIPISNFELTFDGGAKGLVVASRSVCDPPALEFSTDFLAHSGAATSGTTAADVEGCGKQGAKPRAKLKLAKLASGKPRLRLRVRAGSEKLRKAKLKLPKQLAFASGKRFARGTKTTAKVKHTRRSLTLRRGGAGSLTVKVAKGALKAKPGIRANAKLRFKVAVTDVTGHKTKLRIRSR